MRLIWCRNWTVDLAPLLLGGLAFVQADEYAARVLAGAVMLLAVQGRP